MKSVYRYKFIRLDWDNQREMSEKLNIALGDGFEVYKMHADGDEVLILARAEMQD